jgi:hypothetical protein
MYGTVEAAFNAFDAAVDQLNGLALDVLTAPELLDKLDRLERAPTTTTTPNACSSTPTRKAIATPSKPRSTDRLSV